MGFLLLSQCSSEIARRSPASRLSPRPQKCFRKQIIIRLGFLSFYLQLVLYFRLVHGQKLLEDLRGLEDRGVCAVSQEFLRRN